MALIRRHAGNHAREPWTAAIDDAVSIRRVRSTQDGEWKAAPPEYRPGYLPSIKCRPEMPPCLDRKFVNVARRNVMPHVVITGSAVARKIAGNRRENSSGRKRQKTAI